jgi:exodeoxyribonuclease VII large subunit
MSDRMLLPPGTRSRTPGLGARRRRPDHGARARSASGSSTSARSPGRSARPSARSALADVWVEGEVGRVTVSSAGHAYFTLKDARSTLNCVWFSDERARSVFQPQAGLRIVVHGRIDLFEQQGAVQLYVESIQPAGFGDLAIRFEASRPASTPRGCSPRIASGRSRSARRRSP